jgi:hypothetical protein
MPSKRFNVGGIARRYSHCPVSSCQEITIWHNEFALDNHLVEMSAFSTLTNARPILVAVEIFCSWMDGSLAPIGSDRLLT